MTAFINPFVTPGVGGVPEVDNNPIPTYTFPKTVTTSMASRQLLNAVASRPQEFQATVAAAGSTQRLIYGYGRVGAQIGYIKADGGFIYLVANWCLGEINNFIKITFDDEEQASWVVANYKGTTAQIYDATLHGLDSSYVDDLVYNKGGNLIGACYSVLKIPADSFPSSITAELEGKLVYNPATTLMEYTTNPTLHLRDVIVSPIYGQGKTVLDSSVITCAAENDALVGGLKRRRSNLIIDKQAKVGTYIEMLRTYAGCFVVQHEEGVKLVPNRPVTVTRSPITQIKNGSLKITKASTVNTPTVLTVTYTDISVIPWKPATAVAKAIGVDTGTVDWIDSKISLPGITSYAQAYREAVERLNDLLITDLSVEFITYDDSLVDERGDVSPVTHSLGLTAKNFRLLDVKPDKTIGEWKIIGKEYDVMVYSDDVETEPSTPDTTLPSLFNPLPPTNTEVKEELFNQIAQGTHASRLRITWNAPNYPFVQHYKVIVRTGSHVIFEGTTVSTEIVTGIILELIQHDIEVYAYSGLVYSSADTKIFTPLGKYLKPADVTTFTAFEAGGTIFFKWAEVFDIDKTKYELRYGAPLVTWEKSQLIERMDALSFTTKNIAAGTYDFLIKALDSVGNYSNVADRVSNLEVTLDDNAFLVGEHQFDEPTLTSMHQYKLARSDAKTYAVSESNETWNELFPDVMDTYVNPLLSYQNDIVSEYLSEVWDAELELSGDWAAEFDYTVISGTVTAQIELSTDNVAWDVYTLNTKATARYARIRIKSDVGLFLVGWPDMLIRINSIPRNETGEETSLVLGGKTITLTNVYAKAKSIVVTPLGAVSRSYAIDNIDLSSVPNTFDVYVFDSAGAQVVNDFLYEFKGV